MDLRLTGKVALVCAASKGLGRACAEALAKEGANLVICSRTEATLQQTAKEISETYKVEVLPVPCNLNKPEELKTLVQKATDHFSTIDILITNVGHPSHGGLLTLKDEDWRLGFENILYPTVQLCQMVLPYMRKNNWGRIVNISSYVVKEPSADYLISSVFRTSLVALSKCLSQEFGPFGVVVNTVCPSLFRTPLGERLIHKWAETSGKTEAQIEAEKGAITSVGRIGEAEELADLVTYLCSDNAGYVTGQSIVIDGGRSKSLF